MNSALNIPLSQDPTRHNTWRVVRVCVLIMLAWSACTLAMRFFFSWSSVVPYEQGTTVRIVKSSATRTASKTLARGVNIIPDIPISASWLLERAKRTVHIMYSESEDVTVILDVRLPEETVDALEKFGANVVVSRNETLISNTQTPPEIGHSIVRGIQHTLLLSSDGVIRANGHAIPFDIENESVTLRRFAALAPVTLMTTEPRDNTLLLAYFSSNLISSLSSQVITQNTPGLAQLFFLAENGGISVRMEELSEGVSLNLAVPLSVDIKGQVHETDLKQLAIEFVDLPALTSAIARLDDGSRAEILVPQNSTNVIVRDETPYRFITASSPTKIVTVTETPNSLSLSTEQTQDPKQRTSSSCLPGTRALAKPRTLSSFIPAHTFFTPPNITSLLWRAEVVASSASRTRICYSQ